MPDALLFVVHNRAARGGGAGQLATMKDGWLAGRSKLQLQLQLPIPTPSQLDLARSLHGIKVSWCMRFPNTVFGWEFDEMHMGVFEIPMQGCVCV